jgi:hypothetical protein
MNSTTSMTGDSSIPINSEIDILEIISELYRYRYRVLLFSLAIAATVYGGTYVLEEQYESVTRLIVVEPDDPGGVSPDNRRAPEVITLVEHGFILGTTRDNWRDVVMARMRSRTFTEIFIRKAKVAQSLYPQLWNPEKQAWIADQPDRDKVFAEFHENIRFVDHDPKTDILAVRIRWTDPMQASTWANQYVEGFNLYMRERALEDSRVKREYLLQQAESTEIERCRTNAAAHQHQLIT